MEKKWWDRLELQNCGPIKEGRLELGKVNLFIGPNGSGKTTAAKLYNLARLEKTKEILLEFIVLEEEKREELGQIFSRRMREWLNLPSDVEKWQFKYQLKEESKLNREIKKVKNSWMLKLGNFLVGSLAKRESEVKATFLKIVKSLIEESLTNDMLRYVGPERLSIYQNLQNPPLYIEKFFQFVDRGYPNRDYFKGEVLGTEFRVKERLGKRVLEEVESGWELPQLSSGIQSTTLLELYIKGVLDYSRAEDPKGWRETKHRFLIEEPEQHLFPEEQFKLVQFLVKNCNGVTLITHSPYILFSLSLLMYAHYLGHNFPDRRGEVEELIPADYWLDPADFFGYQFEKNGVVTPIPVEEGIIGEEQIGEVRGSLERIFYRLSEIEG